MSEQHTYKGYVFTDETSRTEDGGYRARVRMFGLDNGRRMQRFIDLGTFANEIEARHRAYAAAVNWIDAEPERDKFALPSTFAPLS